MLTEELIKFCNQQYNKIGKCQNCEHWCNNSCEECLRGIHFRESSRGYNCANMAFFYVCKYFYRYSSEIEYLFNQIDLLKRLPSYEVLSIGCGPCSDLFGIINYIERNHVQKNINYCGIDLNILWQPIHKKITSLFEDNTQVNVRFIYKDAFKIVDKIVDRNIWLPNIILFQYVISDMIAKNPSDQVQDFIDNTIKYIIAHLPLNSFIIFNDINHNTQARDYFDYMETELNRTFDMGIYKYHFLNSKRDYTYPYGSQYSSNDITIEIPSQHRKYNPWINCSSAQLILHLRSKK